MTREEKKNLIDSLTEKINNANHIYLTDISDLNAEDTSDLRRLCFQKEIQLTVVKNKLLEKALTNSELELDEMFTVLKGNTSIMFCEQGSVPAKMITEFRKKHKRPLLKAAYVEESVYIGDEQLEALSKIKSKEEVIGDIILLLQSPAKSVISSLQSGGTKLLAILDTLSEKNEE